jgi:hypothetical protein
LSSPQQYDKKIEEEAGRFIRFFSASIFRREKLSDFEVYRLESGIRFATVLHPFNFQLELIDPFFGGVVKIRPFQERDSPRCVEPLRIHFFRNTFEDLLSFLEDRELEHQFGSGSFFGAALINIRRLPFA